jgi:lysozyme
MRPTAIDLIKHFEGCKLKAYQDEGGVWTIGWGCTGPSITESTEWTQRFADDELERRVGLVQAGMARVLEVEPTDNELAALTSFAFNVGLAAWRFSTVVHCHNARETQAAADALLMWNRVKGHVSPGLTKRRSAERAVYLGDLSQFTPKE